MKPPKPNYTTDVYVTKIIDGDTIQVEIIKRVNIRLLNIDAPELSTQEGQDTKEFLYNYLKENTNYFSDSVRLKIPLNDSLSLMDFNSFNRILGEVWVKDENLANVLIKAKKAKKYP